MTIGILVKIEKKNSHTKVGVQRNFLKSYREELDISPITRNMASKAFSFAQPDKRFYDTYALVLKTNLLVNLSYEVLY